MNTLERSGTAHICEVCYNDNNVVSSHKCTVCHHTYWLCIKCEAISINRSIKCYDCTTIINKPPGLSLCDEQLDPDSDDNDEETAFRVEDRLVKLSTEHVDTKQFCWWYPKFDDLPVLPTFPTQDPCSMKFTHEELCDLVQAEDVAYTQHPRMPLYYMVIAKTPVKDKDWVNPHIEAIFDMEIEGNVLAAPKAWLP